MKTTIVQKIRKNKQTLLNLVADYDYLEKQLSENQNSSKSTFTKRQMNFKKDDDSSLIRKFKRNDFKEFKIDILEILIERHKKKKRNYEKVKSERSKKLYDILNNFFKEQSADDIINAIETLMK